MEPTFRLLRVRGIPVGAHWTWPVAFAVVAITLARSVLPTAYPELGSAAHLLMAVVAAALLFACVVLHELAHAVVARREGMPVEGVTLWLLGGVSDAGGRARSPGQELRVAASGPAVSLVLAALFAVASAGAHRLGGPEAMHGVLAYVARLNVLVAAFNLIPALPLDGGRILRAWLWRRQRDLLAATRSGARAGQAFGATMLVVGVLDIWSGAGLVGVWLVVLGAFLLRAVSSELADAQTRHRLEGLTAGDVMSADPGVVLDDTPVARLVENPPAPVRSGYPVLGGGRLLGLVALASARSVPSAERSSLLVQEVMTPLDDIPMVAADDRVLDVLDRLNGDNPIGQVVVVDEGRVVGLLDEGDVAFALDRLSADEDDEGHVEDGQPGRGGGWRGAGARPWLMVGALCLFTGLALYRPPYVVVSPGPAVDITRDVSLGGVPSTPLTGRFVVPSVEVRRTSALGALVAAFRDDRRVVPVGDVDGWAEAELEAKRHPGLARETRILAAVAAARSQGLPATVAGTGVRVLDVRPGSAAGAILRPGDVIVAADGRPVTLAATLTDIVRRSSPGTPLRLWIDRDGEVREVAVTSGEAPGPAGGGGIGIIVETRDLAAQLPFEVRFEGRAAFGPEAGLAYALAIADLLSTDDLARGRTVAAAGTVEADGVVGPVGAAASRADAADRARASMFVAPQVEVDATRGAGPPAEGVESLARALEALSTTV